MLGHFADVAILMVLTKALLCYVKAITVIISATVSGRIFQYCSPSSGSTRIVISLYENNDEVDSDD